jgi:uncharacterized protein
MPSSVRALAALVLLAAVRLVGAAEPAVPKPEGFVTDLAHVIDPATRERITRLAEELRAKTGAEIATVTVRSTAPLDDFTYALRIAEAWKPGRKRDDTGVVFLLAVDDRKVRVLVGYGLEGILPDGRVGEIIDREVVPELRAGRLGEGVWRGVAALARTVAAERGVPLSGVPPPPEPSPPGPVPWLAMVVFLALVVLVLYQASRPRRFHRRRGGFAPWGFGGGFGGGGFGGGSGGFGGFGGGSFGGGGAGRSW